MRDVVVAGAYMTEFGKFLNRGLRSLAVEALDGALADAYCPADEVQQCYFSNVLGGLLQSQESSRGQIWLSDSSIAGTSMVNVENACASGSTALHQAWLSVAAGLVDVAVALGAEKLSHESGSGPAVKAMTSAVDQERLGSIHETLGLDEVPRSLFMEIYANFARRYSQRTGATQEDFARVTVKNHRHGSRNPKAQYGDTLTLEDVLAARPIAGPLTLPMCAPTSDGAAALVVTTRERAAAWGSRPVRVLGIALGGGKVGTYGKLIPATAGQAYEMAGIRPTDVDVLECHDAAAPAELIVMEELGLCPPGEAPKLVRAGETSIGGRIPINPSGGLECKGHPLGATGLAQLVELCDQLRGRAGQRQVDGARIGLAENGGGYLGPDLAAATVTILARE